MTETEHFGLVFAKTGSLSKFGHRRPEALVADICVGSADYNDAVIDCRKCGKHGQILYCKTQDLK
jgi:hypothetical protein